MNPKRCFERTPPQAKERKRRRISRCLSYKKREKEKKIEFPNRIFRFWDFQTKAFYYQRCQGQGRRGVEWKDGYTLGVWVVFLVFGGLLLSNCLWLCGGEWRLLPTANGWESMMGSSSTISSVAYLFRLQVFYFWDKFLKLNLDGSQKVKV